MLRRPHGPITGSGSTIPGLGDSSEEELPSPGCHNSCPIVIVSEQSDDFIVTFRIPIPWGQGLSGRAVTSEINSACRTHTSEIM